MRERHRVGLREARQQAALVALVVEQDDLVVRCGGELAALVAVANRDREGELARDDARAVERDAALHEGAEHGEEAAAGARDGRGVDAVLVDVAVAVEQVRARHAHVGEVQAAVVDAVETALEAVVLAADAGQELALLVADRHVDRVHAVVDAARDELGEHHRGASRAGQRCRGSPSRRRGTACEMTHSSVAGS